MQKIDQKYNTKLQQYVKKTYPMRKQEVAEYRAIQQQYLNDLMLTGVKNNGN